MNKLKIHFRIDCLLTRIADMELFGMKIPKHKHNGLDLFDDYRFRPDTKFIKIRYRDESRIIPLIPVDDKIPEYGKMHAKQRNHARLSLSVGSALYLPFVYDYNSASIYDLGQLATVAHNNIWTLMFGTACMYYYKTCYARIKDTKGEWELHCPEMGIALSRNGVFFPDIVGKRRYIYPHYVWNRFAGPCNSKIGGIMNGDDRYNRIVGYNYVGGDMVAEYAYPMQSFPVYNVDLTCSEYNQINRGSDNHKSFIHHALERVGLLNPTRSNACIRSFALDQF